MASKAAILESLKSVAGDVGLHQAELDEVANGVIGNLEAVENSLDVLDEWAHGGVEFYLD